MFEDTEVGDLPDCSTREMLAALRRSSLLATALSMGFVLALTRRRPQASRTDSVVVSRLSPAKLT